MAPQTISPEGAADSSGPNASMELGQVGQAQALGNSLKSANPPAYAGSQEPGQGGPPSGTATPPATPGQAPSPSQPPPMPSPPQEFKPEFPNLDEGQPWRKRLNVWADSGEHPYLRHFADMANRDIQHHGR